MNKLWNLDDAILIISMEIIVVSGKETIEPRLCYRCHLWKPPPRRCTEIESPTECKWKIARIEREKKVNSLIDWHFTFDMRTVIFESDGKRQLILEHCSSSLCWRHQACQIISVGSSHFRVANHRHGEHLQTKSRRLFSFVRSLSSSLDRDIFRF